MTIGLEVNLEDGSDCSKVKPQMSAIPYQGSQASGSYSALSLDD